MALEGAQAQEIDPKAAMEAAMGHLRVSVSSWRRGVSPNGKSSYVASSSGSISTPKRSGEYRLFLDQWVDTPRSEKEAMSPGVDAEIPPRGPHLEDGCLSERSRLDCAPNLRARFRAWSLSGW